MDKNDWPTEERDNQKIVKMTNTSSHRETSLPEFRHKMCSGDRFVSESSFKWQSYSSWCYFVEIQAGDSIIQIFYSRMTDVRTDARTDGRSYGQTHPLREMRKRIFKARRLMNYLSDFDYVANPRYGRCLQYPRPNVMPASTRFTGPRHGLQLILNLDVDQYTFASNVGNLLP